MDRSFLASFWSDPEEVGIQGWWGAVSRWDSAVTGIAVLSHSSLLHPSSPAADVCYKKEKKKTQAFPNVVVTLTGGLFLPHI